MASLAQLKKRIEAEIEAARDRALRIVCLEVEKVCSKHKWNFSTGWLFSIWKQTPGVDTPHHKQEEVENATTKRLSELIDWYEDEVGRFPQVMYKEGKWFPEGMDEVVHPK